MVKMRQQPSRISSAFVFSRECDDREKPVSKTLRRVYSHLTFTGNTRHHGDGIVSRRRKRGQSWQDSIGRATRSRCPDARGGGGKHSEANISPVTTGTALITAKHTSAEDYAGWRRSAGEKGSPRASLTFARAMRRLRRALFMPACAIMVVARAFGMSLQCASKISGCISNTIRTPIASRRGRRGQRFAWITTAAGARPRAIATTKPSAREFEALGREEFDRRYYDPQSDHRSGAAARQLATKSRTFNGD